MELLNTQEKAHLQKILARSSQLQTADDRRNFLTLCGLIEYCDVQLDKTSRNFVISLLAQLSKVYIKAENSTRLGLVIFLENISKFDLDLSEEDNKFIQYVITKCEIKQVNKPETIALFESINLGQLTRQEYLNRQALLNKVRNFWIKGVLERSLYNQARIELGLEDRLDALDQIWVTPEHPRIPLPRGTKIISKFDELGVGARTLLILGAPGSGKTTTLLELTRDLIDRAEQEIHQPIPVIFNLSSWAGEKQKITDWLMQELKTKYHESSQSLCQTWIEKQQLLLLLDGLDEVRAEQREKCVKAINQFSQEHGQTEIVVTSRIQDYENLSSRLQFQGAIFIQPLTPEQIDDYLNQAGEKLAGVRLALQTDTALQELAQTPLMLSVMALAYEGLAPAELLQMNVEEQHKHLFDKYIERMFVRRRDDRRYPKEQVLHWLKFLAQRMEKESQTLFLIERMQPSWLPSRNQWVYRIGVGLTAGIAIEWLYGLTIGLVGGLLSLHMVLGLLTGLVAGFIGSLSAEIKLFENIGWAWSWRKVCKAAIPGLLGGPTIGLLFWLLGKRIGLFVDTLEISLVQGVTVGITIALISSLFAVLVGADIKNKIVPNQGVWQSAKIAGISTLSILITVIIPIAILGNFFIPLATLLGCISLYSGGLACVQHLTIRSLLWWDGKVPWNYQNLLNYAHERMFLQQVGGGYQFSHGLLRKQLAANNLEDFSHYKKSPLSNIRLQVIAISMTAFCLLSIFLPLSVDSWRVAPNLAQVMTPKLQEHDRLVIDQISYHFGLLKRGDIISFKATDEMKRVGEYKERIRQVIGLPGELVEIKWGRLYIDGNPLSNFDLVVHPAFKLDGFERIPKNSYLVLVNNPNYRDSGFIGGLVPHSHITGRVAFRFWPPHRVGQIN
jgi:signal peptidase I